MCRKTFRVPGLRLKTPPSWIFLRARAGCRIVTCAGACSVAVGMSINFARVAQLDRVTASEAAGCGFNSRRAHHFKIQVVHDFPSAWVKSSENG